MRASACLSCVWILAAALAGGEARAVVLAENGTNACPIFAGAEDEPAARQLAAYLKQISGAEFAVTTGAPPAGGRAIVIGPMAGEARAAARGDSFSIRAGEERLEIRGATRAAVLFGVYAFLEDALGCRWWSCSEEDVPSRPTIRLEPHEWPGAAVFTQTILMNQEAQSAAGQFKYKARCANAEAWTGSHTIYPLLTPYAKAHPDIYPFSTKTGKRAPNDLHFCYSAPDIAPALADALDAEAGRRGGNVRDFLYMAGMGDWYGGACECDRCRAINLEEGWTTTNGERRVIIGGTNLRMMNLAAGLLEARRSGMKVGFMAYMSMEAPPTVTKPASNVYVRIPHLRHCIVHGVAECPRNAQYLRNLKKWCELAPGRVHVWDYGVNFGENFLYPFPVITSIGENIKLYARLGVAGLIVQGNYVSTGGDLVVLKNYVWRKLLWDPSLEIPALIREFCDGYYGPAAEPLYAYVMELEHAVRPAAMGEAHLDEFADGAAIRKAYLTAERMPRLRALVDDARARAAGREPYARRVEEAAVGLDAFALWRAGPLAEADGRLVRTDAGGQSTFDRALRVCEFSRKASAREWGPYRPYHQQFLAMQGGPLVTLSRGDVEVKVTPALGLRIRQVSYKGRPLLRVPADPKEKGYPNLGGAGEQVFPGWTYGELEGEPSTASVTMRTEAGSGMSVKHEAWKSVALSEDGAIRITASSRRATRSPGYENTRCTHVTEYAAGKGQDRCDVEAMGADGQWAPLPLTNAPPVKGKLVARTAPVAPGTRALRIRLTGPGCTVEDSYGAPALKGGTITHSLATGVLTVSAQSGSTAIPTDKAVPWLERTLRISPNGPAPDKPGTPPAEHAP